MKITVQTDAEIDIVDLAGELSDLAENDPHEFHVLLDEIGGAVIIEHLFASKNHTKEAIRALTRQAEESPVARETIKAESGRLLELIK